MFVPKARHDPTSSKTLVLGSVQAQARHSYRRRPGLLVSTERFWFMDTYWPLWMAVFTEKSACGKLSQPHRACQIQGWSFSPNNTALAASWIAATLWLPNSGVAISIEKRKACSKLVSINRACQTHGWPFFSKRKTPAVSCLAATRLVKIPDPYPAS